MELEVEDLKKSKRITKKPNGFKENPPKPKKADNDNEDEEDNDNDNEEEVDSDISNDKDIAKVDQLMIECLNTTNTNNIMECISYLDKIPIELIEYGLRKTARKQYPSWQYATIILDDYVRKKFTTIEQVKADELSFKAQSTNKDSPKEETEEEKNARKVRELEALINGNK
jgi:DNA replication protein DnaD